VKCEAETAVGYLEVKQCRTAVVVLREWYAEPCLLSFVFGVFVLEYLGIHAQTSNSCIHAYHQLHTGIPSAAYTPARHHELHSRLQMDSCIYAYRSAAAVYTPTYQQPGVKFMEKLSAFNSNTKM
jgi:hypothetical protein